MYEEEKLDSKDELRKADHLLYVTLKYTRTSEVILNAIKILINAFELAITDYLEYLKNKKKLKAVPITPVTKYEEVKKFIKKREINSYLRLYLHLKKVKFAEHSKKEEYRKNVALIAKAKGKIIDTIDIEKLKEYNKSTQAFVTFINETISK